MLRLEVRDLVHDQQVHRAEGRHSPGVETRGAAELFDALAHRQDRHRPRTSRLGNSGGTAGSSTATGRIARRARRRSRQASTAGRAKRAADKQVISPITAVRPNDWIAMLSAVSRVAYPMIVVAEQSVTAPPDAVIDSSTSDDWRYR